MLDGIINIVSTIATAIRNVFNHCQIQTAAGTFTLWHFVIVLLIVGIVVSVFVRTGKA